MVTKLSRGFALVASLALGFGALAQPKEEPVPEGVFALPEVRIFIDSPVWFAWKLPTSKFLVAYVQGPAKEGGAPVRQLVVLDGRGKLDAKRTEALEEALRQADPSGQCLETGDDRMPLLMPLGTRGLVLQPSASPLGACLLTWNARRSAIEIQTAASAREFCEPSGCPPKQCWLTENCWLPEGPELDLARKGLHSSSLAHSLIQDITGPGDAVLAATLPGSGAVLLWVPSWRQADPGDAGKGRDSRLFVYDSKKRAIDTVSTLKLAKALQGPVDECQGLGTVKRLQRREKGVAIQQRYTARSVRLRCSSTVTWSATGRKFVVVGQPSGEGNESATPRAGEERTDENAQAQEMWKGGQRDLALAVWERLYAQADYGNPAFAEVCNNLGFAYRVMREHQKAEEVLLDCEKSFPEHSEVLLNLADVYRDLGRSKEAIPRYELFLQREGGSPAQRKAAEKALEKLKARQQ